MLKICICKKGFSTVWALSGRIYTPECRFDLFFSRHIFKWLDVKGRSSEVKHLVRKYQEKINENISFEQKLAKLQNIVYKLSAIVSQTQLWLV